MTGNWRWTRVNQSSRKAVRFSEKYGFWPTEEACECGKARELHYPEGITHSFISTKKKV